MRNPCLLVAALMMYGCAAVTPPLMLTTTPALDQSLAAPCLEVKRSTSLDYDVWDAEWAEAMRVLADCAIRKRKIVEAWPAPKVTAP
jgi:hypothetical protein